MKRGFSLVELMIVVAVLGILAAIVVPQFQSHTTQARMAAAKNNLHILRVAIELYAAQHNDVPPGYPNDNSTQNPAFLIFLLQMVKTGHYLSELPENPFNDMITMKFISNSEQFPAEATGDFGWVYKPQTKEIRLDWPGTDKEGIRYYDY
jgi:general secretion pathway protein G